MSTSYIFYRPNIIFTVRYRAHYIKPERSEGKVFNVKIISERSERKYICNNKHAERSEAKVFSIMYKASEASLYIYI